MARRKSPATDADQNLPSRFSYPGKVNPLPASPSRPPVGIITAHNIETGRRIMQNYCTHYALRRFFDTAVSGQTFKQLTHEKGITSDGIEITSPQLDTILEYEYKSDAEESWPLPVEHAAMLDKLRNASVEALRSITAPPKPPRSRQHGSPVSRDGLTPLQSICEELNIEPKHARQALRSSKLEKPAAGWAFTTDQIDEVKKILSGAKR